MKESIEDLAILDGHPAFIAKLHVGQPNIGDREQLLEHINDLLDRRWLTNNGPFVREFEERIANLAGVKHCIATCNGTMALEIAIRAADLRGEVIIPSMTFIATAHALQWQGIAPVFCDIDPRTYQLDPHLVEDMITPATTGIIGVHLFGHPCDVDALVEIADRYNLKLLFDAAHAFGCSCKERMIGGFGDAEVFSFHATKILNTFEGGAVVTNNDDLASKIHLMKNFGFAGYDNVIYIGTNGKMNEASAAMGLVSLIALDEFITVNYRNYKQYQQELGNIPGIRLMIYDETEKCNYHYIVLEIDDKVTGVTRNQLVEILHAENVMARRYFYPGCHRMEPYRSCFPHAGLLLPKTERIVKRVLSLPTGTAISLEDVNKICELIRFVIKSSSGISKALENHRTVKILPELC